MQCNQERNPSMPSPTVNDLDEDQETQLRSLEMQLKILKAKDEIRTFQCRLNMNSEEL